MFVCIFSVCVTCSQPTSLVSLSLAMKVSPSPSSLPSLLGTLQVGHWNILEYTRIYWSILEYTGVYWSILEYTGIYWSILEYTGVYWSILEYTGIYWSILEYTGIYWNILEYTGVYRNILEYTGIYRNILVCGIQLEYICSGHRLTRAHHTPAAPNACMYVHTHIHAPHTHARTAHACTHHTRMHTPHTHARTYTHAHTSVLTKICRLKDANNIS